MAGTELLGPGLGKWTLLAPREWESRIRRGHTRDPGTGVGEQGAGRTWPGLGFPEDRQEWWPHCTAAQSRPGGGENVGPDCWAVPSTPAGSEGAASGALGTARACSHTVLHFRACS